MAKRMIQNLDELRKMVGQEVGVSDWHPVTQQAINMFADATLDHQREDRGSRIEEKI